MKKKYKLNFRTELPPYYTCGLSTANIFLSQAACPSDTSLSVLTLSVTAYLRSSN